MTPEAHTEYIVSCIREAGSMYPGDAKAFLAEHDAHRRSEVLAEVKTEVVAWLVKKATERRMWDAGVLASKVDRGAVRAFLGTGHYRDAMDAHRGEVLREAAAELDRIADTIEAGAAPGSAQVLRDAAGNVRYLARQDTSGAPGGESTQPAPDPMPVIRAVLADFNFDAYEAFTEYDRLGIRSDPDAEWVGDLASAIAGAIGGETEDAAPDFFQPGRTYSDGNGYQAPELITLFRVEHVTRHPDRGHLRAIGWMKSGTPGAPWHGHFQDEGEFEGWIEAGESRG